MADLGMLGGIAEGIKSGIEGFRTERDYQQRKSDEALQKAMQQKMYKLSLTEKGLMEGPGDTFAKTDQQQAKENQAFQAGTAGIGKTRAETFKDIQEGNAAYIGAQYKNSTPEMLKQAAQSNNLEQANDAYEKALQAGAKAPSQLQAGVQKTVKSLGLQNVGFLQSAGLAEGNEEQLADQAKQELISRLIKDDGTGKMIKDPAMRKITDQLYFKQQGDSPDVVNQKNVARNREIQSQKAQTRGLLPQMPSNQDVSTQVAKKNLQPSGRHSVGGLLESSAQANELPKPGVVQGGYKFKGGDPSNPQSWEKQ